MRQTMRERSQTMSANPRYDGKPLLRLLELYVLWAIGELSEVDEGRLVAMTPKLQSIYGVSGAWHDVLAAAVHMPKDMPASIQQIWAKNTAIANKKNANLSPQVFAEMFVDENLAK
jgi:hypothetical protein